MTHLEIRTNWIGGTVSEDESREVRKILREAGETKKPSIDTRYVQEDSHSIIAVHIESPSISLSPQVEHSIKNVFEGSITSIHLH